MTAATARQLSFDLTPNEPFTASDVRELVIVRLLALSWESLPAPDHIGPFMIKRQAPDWYRVSLSRMVHNLLPTSQLMSLPRTAALCVEALLQPKTFLRELGLTPIPIIDHGALQTRLAGDR